MMGKRSEGKMVLVTRWILNFMLVSGVLVFVSLPFLLQYAGDHYAPIIKEHYVLYLIVYLISGVMGIIIVYCLRKMIGTVIRRNCFVEMCIRDSSNRAYDQTMLVITHDENIALQADRIITLEDGKIIRDEVVR